MRPNITSSLLLVSVLAAAPFARAEDTQTADDGAEASTPATERDERGPLDSLAVGVQLYAGWSFERDGATDTTANEFEVRRAKLQLEWKPVGWLEAALEIDAAEGFGAAMLKDAYIEIAPLSQLEIRIGQFKKPFSELELTSASKRKLVEKGPGNDFVIEDLMYGDRDLGVQLSGRLIKAVKLDYLLGGFNGSGANLGDPGRSKDLVARLQMRPTKPLRFGVNGSFKFFDDAERPEGKPAHAFATGLDARLTIAGFALHLEGLFGQNHIAYIDAAAGSSITEENPPELFDVLGIISYRFETGISWGFAIEPAFKAELLDPDTVIVDDQVLALTPGINLYFGEHFRLMVDGEFIRSWRNAAAHFPDEDAIMVLACFDI